MTKELLIDSPLGFMKIQELAGKLCQVKFLDKKPLEIKNESTEFLENSARQFHDYFNGNLTVFSLLQHISQPGTPFQQKVWDELKNIPFGSTITYLQLAIKLGDEKCIRAAASANGRNNIAIAVPCHRVIGSDGSLTGYAGKLWRKKWLLDHEAKQIGRLTQAQLF